MSRTVVVIGGGVIGAACAYYLRLRGWQVTVLEAHRFGAGCSHANCGFVCPSHVLPLASPGVLREGLLSLLRPTGPLRIAPRFDPNLWSWLWQFARRCHRSLMIHAGGAIQPLLQSSRRLFDQLLTTESLNADWQARGMLFVFSTPRAMAHYAHTDALLRKEFALAAKPLTSSELHTLEPALRPGLAGAWFYDTDAHLKPDLFMRALETRLIDRGVRVVENSPVIGFQSEKRRITAAITPDASFSADSFVLATGSWSSRFSKYLGVRLPIQPGKGYSITFSRPAVCPRYPLIFEEHRVAITPFTNSYRIGSTMEFAGYDDTLNRRRLAYLTNSAAAYLREPPNQTVLEEWYGWRPMTPDGVPVIDRSLIYPNLYVAAGHNMLGLSMAPATGKLIAELLTNTAPHLDPTPYRLDRFSR
ncbi:MAG: FAD-dependent oxidoreductase [Gemmataceae bacterium]|nr:FAD-dependent oxidoreductase [Gemmataceae bacterium]